MVQRAGRLGFLYEPALAFGISNLLGWKDLDGHEAVQVGVAGLGALYTTPIPLSPSFSVIS